jgi:hypothetical protein
MNEIDLIPEGSKSQFKIHQGLGWIWIKAWNICSSCHLFVDKIVFRSEFHSESLFFCLCQLIPKGFAWLNFPVYIFEKVFVELPDPVKKEQQSIRSGFGILLLLGYQDPTKLHPRRKIGSYFLVYW